MMNKKGITPVVAMIMLLLIVVSLAGGFLIWMNRTWQSLEESGTEAVKSGTEKMTTSFAVDNVWVNGSAGVSEITIRNNGKSNIKTSELSIYFGGKTQNCAWPNSTIGPDDVLTCTVSEQCNGTTVKVTGPGQNKDSASC
ncbi:MAG: hypothetical protein ABEK36_06510 [Candidatus Aenigmatarchaeota archaeon]